MDPRYTDFCEVEFSALHPILQKRCEIRVDPISIQVGQHSKALVVAWLGGSSLAAYW